MNLPELERLLREPEAERLEFKEARNRFDFEELLRYCVAIANEGGGSLILGVSRTSPRRVTGSNAFPDLEGLRKSVFERIQVRVETFELRHPVGRVVAIAIPRRPTGRPLQIDGAYLMRAGDALVGMTVEQLRRILDESSTDASAEICRGAQRQDLSSEAIERYRQLWARRSGNDALAGLPPDRLLEDGGLLVEGAVTVASLVLLGTQRGLERSLPAAEAIFEYRSGDGSTSPQSRLELRSGFLLGVEALWTQIQLRNDLQHFQDGLFIREIPTFRESVVREALLNAFCHRDYRRQGSIMIRQFRRRLEIVSPGGLPEGITIENIIRRNSPRNRLLAEALGRCGLVERGGQGMDRMFRDSVLEGKPTPAFEGTDEYQVVVNIHGEVSDVRFLKFLEAVGQERLESFSAEDLLAIDRVYRGEKPSAPWRERLPFLAEAGVLEKVGQGRGSRYLLSRRFHGFLGERGAYTRRKGLDRDTNKALLQKHLMEAGGEGAPLSELMQVLPSLGRKQVQGLLAELRREGLATSRGRTRAGRWYDMGAVLIAPPSGT